MKKINFLFAVHCHQPVGNFEHVIEDAYRMSYLPFIETLEKFPSIKITAHYTGILLSWFEKKHPEFLKKLKALVDRGQIEMMTGAYYEPILTVIPDEDKTGQILKQTKFIREHFGTEPKGLWLAERIWEPSLPEVLYDSCIKYTALDDYHFISAGLDKDSLKGYYITEDNGKSVKIFPIDKKLRYLIPFRLPHETIDYLREIATEDGCNAAIMADDGEKLGVWPGTHKWVFEEKWLENFFSMLEKEKGWIITRTFSDYSENFEAKGRIYIPTASYFEMMEWSLLTEAGKKFEAVTDDLKATGRFEKYQQFVKGGFWRNFFVKYPESNNMHKKMLMVSEKVRLAKNKTDVPMEAIFDELWQGQCNCSYWHGVFGGLYLNYLRHAVYTHLINAESMADEILHENKQWLNVDVKDFDKDGNDEILVSTKYLNLYFSPKDGGSLFELDYKPKSFNLINTLARREEAYHKHIVATENHQLVLDNGSQGAASIHEGLRVKEMGLKNFLNYDWYKRVCFTEHFLAEDTDIDKYRSCKYQELGDFVNMPYEYSEMIGKNEIKIKFTREGNIFKDGNSFPIRITKTFTVHPLSADFEVDWTIANLSDHPLDLWLGIEYNMSLLAGNDPDRYYVIGGKKPDNCVLNSIGQSHDIYEFGLIDKWSSIGIIVDGSKRIDLWRFPVETVSQSEGGYERTYQSSALLSHMKLSIPVGGEHLYSIKFTIKEKF